MRSTPLHPNPPADGEDRLRIDALIADLSASFVNLPSGEVDRGIMDAQRRICELLGLDFSTLWQWSGGVPALFRLTHFYSAREGPQAPDRMKQEQYPWAREQLLEGHIIKITSPEDLPPEARRDRETLLQFGIKSNLVFPISVGGGPPLGFLGFGTTQTEREWPELLVERLQAVERIFANALARKHADRALRESERRRNLAVDAAQLGLWEWTLRGNQVWGSERWLQLFGFTAGEEVDFEKVIQRIHPDDRETVEKGVGNAVASKEDYAAEFRIVLPDGTRCWISSRGRIHLGPDGMPIRMMGAAIDITERKQAEELLYSSRALLETGADLAGLGCYEIDFDIPSSFADERFHKICGAPSGRHGGLEVFQFWMDHLHPDDRPRVLKEREELHDGRIERVSIKYRYLHPTEGEKWIHHLARVSDRDATGRALRTFGVVRDITGQERTAMEIREARENLTHLARVNTLGELSGSLAHELNQPLGIILSNAQAAQELLLQTPPDLAEVQDILADIVSADRRAGEVIRRMRALLKRGQASILPLSLNQVIEEVLHLLQADLIARGINVNRDLAPELPPIMGDRVQLQQLTLNLVLNAADAMATNVPGTRRLHLQTGLHEGRVHTSVRDEGCGLPADADRLFEPFHTTKPQGLGLGLAICRSIVTAHNGRIWAEPHPEHGAVFCFELPIAEGTDTP